LSRERKKAKREGMMEIKGRIVAHRGAKIIVSTEDEELYEMPRMAAKLQLPDGQILFEANNLSVRRVEE